MEAGKAGGADMSEKEWVVLGRTGGGHIGVGPKGETVTSAAAFINALHDEALANAAVVAAAPDMQAACEKALNDLANMTSEAFSKGADKPLRDALQAALDKSRTLPVLEKRKRRKK